MVQLQLLAHSPAGIPRLDDAPTDGHAPPLASHFRVAPHAGEKDRTPVDHRILHKWHLWATERPRHRHATAAASTSLETHLPHQKREQACCGRSETVGIGKKEAFAGRRLQLQIRSIEAMCEGIIPGEMHHHVVAASPHGPQRAGLFAAAGAAAGAPTAEPTSKTLRGEHAAGNCAAVDVDLMKPNREREMETHQQQTHDPCFPACLALGVEEVRIIDTPETHENDDTSAMAATTSSGRRSRRNSRRLSLDNQSESEFMDASLDLEDVARGVLSPVDARSQAPAPGSIVVEYDEGMPERSRTGLLLRDCGTAAAAAADCAPDACNPLDALAFDEHAIEDFGMTAPSASASTPVRITGRPRLGSASQPKTPKTPSRRGKSVLLSGAPVITTEVETLLAPVSYTTPAVTVVTEKKEDKDEDENVERCSKLHKLCLCEVKLHKSLESCWLVAFGSVYDVTGLVDVHPAGPRSILRKAGGADCTKDMKFHSKAARKMMEKCFIGKLAPCGEDPEEADAPAACTIM